MAKNANKLNPENSSYQDTYGWVLYKMNKLEEAEIWILKALKNSAHKNAVILEHYGDIQFKLGNKEEAISYWEKAAEAGKASEFLPRKIEERKLIE